MSVKSVTDLTHTDKRVLTEKDKTSPVCKIKTSSNRPQNLFKRFDTKITEKLI